MNDNSPHRLVDIFFYGLYMDPEMLKQRGVQARNPRLAVVENYALCLGNRATILRSRGDHAYGVVYSLTHQEIHGLYWGIGLDVYVPEALSVQIINGPCVPAICCLLLEPPKLDEQNPDYIEKLGVTMSELGLPETDLTAASPESRFRGAGGAG